MRNHLAAFAAMLALSVSTARASDYRIETYDFPGAASSVITGINSAGRVIGVYTLPNMTTTGPRGSLGFTVFNGTYTQIGDSTLCRPAGRCLVFISSINSWGVIAGTFSADVDFPGIFYQTAIGPRGFVQPPGFPNTAVLTLAGLNDLGEVAGCYFDSNVQLNAFIQIGGIFRNVSLPIPNASGACARGLNNLGQLTGDLVTGTTTFTRHGFVLTGNHAKLIDIPADWDYDGESISPLRINDLGIVIGTYNDTSGNAHGFAVNGENVAKIDFPGAIATRPVAINNRGDIVGSYDIATTNPVGVQTLPFILRAGAYSTVVLPVSGAVAVAGIDNFGRLFGLYDTHGFVATPAAN